MKCKFAFLPALAALIMICNACKKKEADPEPAPDPYTYSSDLQAPKDLTRTFLAITDIEMICGFIGEAYTSPKFYLPSGASGGLTIIRDTIKKTLTAAYNNVKCVDGKLRNGTIVMDYAFSNPNAKYYHEFEYLARVMLINFEVDGWMVRTVDKTWLTLKNNVKPVDYNPANTNLSWELSGKLTFINKIDSSKTITWEGTLVKTLVNTNNPAVFNPNKKNAINWINAVVNYTGEGSGTILGVPYTCKIENVPVKRDFNCNFIPAGSSGISEFHPFITGSVLFSPDNWHPRTVDFGPADPGPCDFQGTVSFKNETHSVDFE